MKQSALDLRILLKIYGWKNKDSVRSTSYYYQNNELVNFLPNLVCIKKNNKAGRKNNLRCSKIVKRDGFKLHCKCKPVTSQSNLSQEQVKLLSWSYRVIRVWDLFFQFFCYIIFRYYTTRTFFFLEVSGENFSCREKLGWLWPFGFIKGWSETNP